MVYDILIKKLKGLIKMRTNIGMDSDRKNEVQGGRRY